MDMPIQSYFFFYNHIIVLTKIATKYPIIGRSNFLEYCTPTFTLYFPYILIPRYPY